MPVEDTSVVETTDLLLFSGNQTIIHWSPDSIVSSYLQETFEITNVDISLYKLNVVSENYTLIKKLATNVPNSGVYDIMIPSIDQSENVIAGIIGIGLSEQSISQSTHNVANTLRLLLANAIFFSPVLYITTLSLNSRISCSLWLSSEPENIGEIISMELPPCPKTMQKAEDDNTNFEEEKIKLSTKIFHSSASSCFRQRNPTRFAINSNHNHSCSYVATS